MRSSKIRNTRFQSADFRVRMFRGRKNSEVRHLRSETGFTLIEVMMAIAIIGLVATLVLVQRIEIVAETTVTRDMRTAWALAAQKMAQIEMEIKQEKYERHTSSGNFDNEPEFRFEYTVDKEEIVVSDPNASQEKRAEILKIKLTVTTPGKEPIVLEAYYPKQETTP